MRKLITWIGNRVNRYLTGVAIKDFGSAYRIFDAEVLDLLKDTQACVHYNTPALYLNARNWSEIPIEQYKRPHGRSKWTFIMFVLYNLDFVASSIKPPQILVLVSFFGFIIGSVLYLLNIFGFFEEVRAISAPISISFTSFVIAILALMDRLHEVLSNLELSYEIIAIDDGSHGCRSR